ncbi:MAG: hypothetical protein DI536_22475 [Archangium gephyra]|uniref:Uncharacterized protein n=1 Tax=Archangium gephyra TaxID=48 RepID=A0A2W5T0T1_9BACT|nr:MAG: hypothetical protein DI536_22475 [Archangium gephyra]
MRTVGKFRVLGSPTPLMSMLDGTPAKNLLGCGDPCVVRFEDRWTMFVGGFQTNFKNNLFALQSPEHAALDSDAWQFVGERGRATPLISQPDRTSWDHFGLHTPSYVRGEVGGVPVERIFYAGRGSTRVVDNTTPYSIGVLTRREGAWHRHPDPVLTGTGDSPNVLEPKAA